jgi:hypothetical protein
VFEPEMLQLVVPDPTTCHPAGMLEPSNRSLMKVVLVWANIDADINTAAIKSSAFFIDICLLVNNEIVILSAKIMISLDTG